MKRQILITAALAAIFMASLSACGSTQKTDTGTFSENVKESSKAQDSDAASVAADGAADSGEESAVPADESITTNGGTRIGLGSLEHYSADETKPSVYYISDISPESLVRAYKALEWTPSGKTAVKISTGEPPASNYLKPDLIRGLVDEVDGTIVECMTAYGGKRSSAASAKQVAEDHGYTGIAAFDLMDEEGEVSIPVENGKRLKEVLAGSHISDYDSVVVLSHFKGHAMAGFGGAIKNVAIGMSSRDGKALVHSGGTSTSNIWGGDQDAFLEALGEATSGVSDYFGRGSNIVYVSVMNRLSVDCDCDGNPEEPDMHDVGILASADPVALDQACVDLVYAVPDGDSLIRRMESRDGMHTLEHAEEIGLGSRTYHLVDIDA